MNITNNIISQAINVLQKGGIIAYPTEAVYGLGCDPFNKEAVLRILKLKNRSRDKGLIIIINNWSQITSYIKTIPNSIHKKINATWPNPITWLLPANEHMPSWITGKHETVAVRIIDHPIATALCKQFGKPIVSTSANIAGGEPALDHFKVKQLFHNQIDLIIPGTVGSFKKTSEIRDAISDKIIRQGGSLT